MKKESGMAGEGRAEAVWIDLCIPTMKNTEIIMGILVIMLHLFNSVDATGASIFSTINNPALLMHCDAV